MAYSDFKLTDIIDFFGLSIDESSGLFANVPEQECSDLLTTILRENVDLAVAISSEKARSEMIISPILLEIRRKFNYEISLFSGVDFTVDTQRGLNGFCDFILSLSSEQLLVRSPVIVLVESKNENLRTGLAQCIAEMIAAQVFNEKNGNSIKAIYGVVSIDLSEYYIKDINKILGILYAAIAQNKF
jgi:hypothetical protein